MKATETKFEEFLSKTKSKYVIPVYQRNYDWKKEQCKQLINDILLVGGSDIKAHFIGSIVYIHDGVYTTSRVAELTIIDGQQRLTTITLIYLILYSLLKEMNDMDRAQEIYETFLVNKFLESTPKLVLTENNKSALMALFNQEEHKEYSQLTENYDYLKQRIKEENFETIISGLSKLIFVEVSLERDNDDPQRIFESLNSTGLELSQGDLIRNYILMRLKPVEQKMIYDKYWKIIEANTLELSSNINQVSDFIRDYLTTKIKKIPNKNKVYVEYKERYQFRDDNERQVHLSELKKLSKHYNKLLNPQNENDHEIRSELKKINKLEIRVTYPFLVNVFDDYAEGIIEKGILIKVLKLVQSFVWRRFVVGLPTNALNKIFMTLYDKVDKSNYYQSLEFALIKKGGTGKFPNNREFSEIFMEKDLYNIQSRNRTYMLEMLENFNNKETVVIDDNQDITIEHIFPQKPDDKWTEYLDDDEMQNISEKYLHTIGNLTLTGYNIKLSNKYFIDKRDMKEIGYKDSRLWLNKYLASVDKWDVMEIKKRAQIICDRALKIWEYPSVEIKEKDKEESNIFDVGDPTGEKLEYIVFLNQRTEMYDIIDLFKFVIPYLFENNAELFFNTDLGELLCLTDDPGSLRKAYKLGASHYVESNLSSKDVFAKIRHALKVFEYEEELIIKFKSNGVTH